MSPQSMRAIVQRGYGPPAEVLALAEVPWPAAPGPGEVRLQVRATSVNTPDWVVVTGTPAVLRLRFGLRRPATAIRGTDLAGVVESVGPGVDWKPGDEVFGSTWDPGRPLRAGAFAEVALADGARLARKPAGVSFEDAAASVMSGLTASIALREVAPVGPGKRVLVNGASGGVGTFAVQIARALGAEVTAVCGPRNLELVRGLGAHHVIDYTVEDYTRGSARYDVVLDNVLNHPPAATARVLAPGGTFLPNSVGNSGGWFAGLPRIARASLLRGARTVECTVDRARLDALGALLASGEVRVVTDEVYPLARAADAVAHMFAHHARGKVVIRV